MRIVDGRRSGDGCRLTNGYTYLFVDGNYLQCCCAEVARVVLDEQDARLSVKAIKARFGADKVFYYDSVDDRLRQSAGGREDEEPARVRAERHAEYLEQVNQVDDVHVVRGTVTGRAGNRRQKEVDVKLAVDALMHASRRNMQYAVLLSGDLDFRPVINALVELGVNVTVAGDRRAPRRLREAADRFRELDAGALVELLDPQSLRHGLPGVRVRDRRPLQEPHAQGATAGFVGHGDQRREVRELGVDIRYLSLQVSPGLTPGASTYFECARAAGGRAQAVAEGMIEYYFGSRPVWS